MSIPKSEFIHKILDFVRYKCIIGLGVIFMATYETKSIFGKNLSKIIDRTEDMTQLKLAKLMNVSPSSVSSWCNGEKMPRMDKIEWLVDYFKISKSDLLELKPSLKVLCAQVYSR